MWLGCATGCVLVVRNLRGVAISAAVVDADKHP
jgi:hypothetical protein